MPKRKHVQPASGDEASENDDSDAEDFISLMPVHETNEQKEERTERNGGKSREGSNRMQDRNSLPPWMAHYVNYSRTNPLVALHNEMVSFCRLMEPRSEEMKTREDLVAKFTALARSVFEDCEVCVFGSQATGLCLPTSDIDIAIQIKENETETKDEETGDTQSKKQKKTKKKVTKEQELEDMANWNKPTGSPLQRLATALRDQWIEDLSYLEVIENTRIPLVKFTHAPTDISIDVCFNQMKGVQAATLMRQYMQAIPPLRPLTFVLKKFLASRGLNQPYTGGVGSFLLQMMILAFLQHRERDAFNNRAASQYNLGALLVEFFEFYSTDFNFVTTGISVRFDGFFFPKGAQDRKENFWQTNRPFSIAMENPLDPTFDVGSPSFRIDLVQRSFDVAFKVLLSHVSEPMIPPKNNSILASILEPSEEMWERRPPLPNFGGRRPETSREDNFEQQARKRQRRN